MSEPSDTISIPAHLITDNATLALSGSTITLEFPTREDAEAVRDCLMGEDGISLTLATMDELKRHFGTKTSAETFRSALKAAKGAVEAIISLTASAESSAPEDPMSKALTSLRSGLCGCHACVAARGEWQVVMHLCPTCGNKRCPKATDHSSACSGSNEPGQHGSLY